MLSQEIQNQIEAEVRWTAEIYRQPHVYMRPKVFRDSDMWCALLGENLQEGVSGFGTTPIKACQSFDLVFLNSDAKTAQKAGK